MRQLSKVVLPVVAAVLFLLPNTASAQTGAIAGQVRDASGGALPGVTVEVTSPALIEKVRTSTTDDSGRYQITALPVGTYEVTFTLQNFGTVKRGQHRRYQQLHRERRGGHEDWRPEGHRERRRRIAGGATFRTPASSACSRATEIADLPTERDLSGLMNLVPLLTSSETTEPICVGGVGLFCNGISPAFNSHVGRRLADGQNQGRIMVYGMVA